jgi:hypothetical protein
MYIILYKQMYNICAEFPNENNCQLVANGMAMMSLRLSCDLRAGKSGWEAQLRHQSVFCFTDLNVRK